MLFKQKSLYAAVQSPNGATTDYTYNAFNEVLSETSSDRGTTSYTYDLAGNLKTTTDAQQQTTTYLYDALNRVTRINYADGQFERYLYDQGTYGKGRFTSVIDASGTLRYYFNKFGNLYLTRQTTDGQVLDHRYAYNKFGLVSKMTYPSGLELRFAYNKSELRTIRVNGEIFMKGIQYFPFGDVRVWRWGSDNSVYAKVFDLKGQVTRHPLPFANSTVKRTLVYDPIGRITKYNDPAHPTFKDQNFTYDALGRLTNADAGAWYDQTLTYDNNGNRLSESFLGQDSTYSYLNQSNVLNTLTGATATTYQYDANGNTLFDGKHSLTYDSKNRFNSVVTDDNQFVQYLQNGLGQRVAKTTATETTLYNYSESGSLLGEYQADGTAISETIYLFGQPVGVYRNNTLYRVYADHLGTPRVITNNPVDTAIEPLESVWEWNSDPFGSLPVDSDPDGDGTEFVFNQRMPGQYYDVETGYFYNYFRTYDPSTGRYLQSDPIGLGGGLNTFGYVGANPIMFMDIYGLDWTTADFWNHYYWNGNGKTVHLNDVGLQDRFRNSPSVALAQRNVFNQYKNMLNNQLQNQCPSQCDTDLIKSTYIDAHHFDSLYDVTWDGGLFSVGDGQLFNKGSCVGAINCKTGNWTGGCDLRFYARDWFRDIFGVQGATGGRVKAELRGAVPYRIWADWYLTRRWDEIN